MAKTSERRCAFCERKKDSAEHVFADWLCGIIPRTEETTKHVTTIVTASQFDARPGALHRSGSPSAQTIRCVCEGCNNGWMSQLQSAAKPAILRLLDGNWASPTDAERLNLANWAAMFVMVVEHADVRTMVVPRVAREAFAKNLTPPPYWTVYCAPYTGTRWNGCFWHRSGWSSTGSQAFQFTMYATAGLIWFVFAAFGSQSPLHEARARSAIRMTRVWPPDVEWRARSDIDELEAYATFQTTSSALGADLEDPHLILQAWGEEAARRPSRAERKAAAKRPDRGGET